MSNKIEIDDSAAEDVAAIMVCMRVTSPLLLLDNEIGKCSQCGEAIQHRPHAPKALRKICAECAVTFMLELDADDLRAVITSITAAELELLTTAAELELLASKNGKPQ